MSTVINLGKYMFTNLLNEWLELLDICIFETALCNLQIRKVFQSNYVWKKVDISKQVNLISFNLLEWASTREFTISNLIMTNHIRQHSRNYLFLTSCRKIFHSLSPVLSSVNFDFSNLKSLSFEGCKLHNVSLLREILQKSSQLTELSLTHSEHITDTIGCVVAQSCLSLTSYNFQSTKFGDDAIIRIVGNCSQLTKLEVNDCPLISNKSIDFLAKYCPQLVHLNVFGCGQINVDKLIQSCSSFPDLEVILFQPEFELSPDTNTGNKNKTFKYLLALGKTCPRLRTLKSYKDRSNLTIPLECSQFLKLSPHYRNITALDLSVEKLTEGAMLTICTNSPLITDITIDSASYINLNNEHLNDIFVVIANNLVHLTKCTFRLSQFERNKRAKSFFILSTRFESIQELSFGNDIFLCGTPHSHGICCTENILEEIDNFTALERMKSHEYIWSYIAPKCSALTSFALSVGYYDKNWLPDCENMRQLVSIDVRGMDVAHVLEMTTKCSKLTKLHLWCNDMSSVSLTPLFERNNSLTSISLSGEAYLTQFLNDALISLSTNCLKLRYLSIHNTTAPALDCIDAFPVLFTKCRQIQELRFKSICVPNFRQVVISALTLCRRLLKLTVSKCEGVKEGELEVWGCKYNRNVVCCDVMN